MKYILMIALIAIASTAWACTGFYSHESVDGMYKICYYDHLGSTVAITKSSASVCPVTISVQH